jgi:hypothetical protein
MMVPLSTTQSVIKKNKIVTLKRMQPERTVFRYISVKEGRVGKDTRIIGKGILSSQSPFGGLLLKTEKEGAYSGIFADWVWFARIKGL